MKGRRLLPFAATVTFVACSDANEPTAPQLATPRLSLVPIISRADLGALAGNQNEALLVNNLGTLGGSSSTATAINNPGDIVGAAERAGDPPNKTHAVLWHLRRIDLGFITR